jgi:hypothetical protein
MATTASAIYVIPETQCIGTSLQYINSNFALLNQQIANDSTAINTLSAEIANIGYTTLSASNFVYSIYSDGSSKSDTSVINSNTIKMTNQWQDVFVDCFLTPLRIAYTNNTPYTYTALLQGKIYARNYTMAATSFYRLAQFSSLTNTVTGVPATPLSVIDTAACEGNVNYSHAYNTVLQDVFTLQPYTSYVFGLQTWIPNTGASPKGFVQINGWQTNAADAGTANGGLPINYLPASYVASKANGATIGYPNGATYSDPLNSIGVYSYLKLIVL